MGSPGLDASIEYAAARLAAAGVAPLGDGSGRSWFQAIPMRRILDADGALELVLPGAGPQAWRAGVDCVLPEAAPQVISGEVVFAGYGIREPALGHDDFRGLDVRGRIVVFVGGLPPGERSRRPDLVERYGAERPEDRYDARLDLLEDLGAKAAVAIEDGLEARLRASGARRAPYFVGAAGEAGPPQPPLARVAPAGARALLARVGMDPAHPLAYRAAAAAGTTATLRMTGREEPAASRNVIGVLPGSDPALRGEAVVIGAHLDHLGMEGGVLHPGADDNASGVAAVLEIAKAIAAGAARPRRTLVFAFWTIEEAGHFGSDYYVRHPAWPLAATSAYVNLDMIAHPWADAQIRELVTGAAPCAAAAFLAAATPGNFAEPGFDAASPWLGDALATAARGTGMTLHLDRADGRHGGSDYRGFARRGIPWIRFFGNFFPEYHEPGDTPANLDPAQAARMARLALATTWLLADR